jgi:hypothetical protein
MVLHRRDRDGAGALTSAEWPELRLSRWRDTKETLHRWTQIVGKVRLALETPVNHWWHVPLYVSARGLTTSAMPCARGLLELEFDFRRRRLEVTPSWDEPRLVALEPRTTASFYEAVLAALRAVGVDVRLWPVPVELPGDTLPFDEDVIHRSYDAAAAERFHRALLAVRAVLEDFRCGFAGKCSPVHFFWGSFDLAVTRFSGRRAPPRPGADPVTAEAYSHEVSSAGWWPGGGAVDDAAFYSYAAPEPAGFRDARVRPREAFYHEGLKEFLLMHEDVRASADPKAAALEFLESTYEAAADLGRWDRPALERTIVARR